MSISHTRIALPSVVARQRGRQRRPQGGVYRDVTKTFLERLEGQIAKPGWSARRITQELAQAGHRFDESSVSNIRNLKYPSSRAVGPICELFGWPKPPATGLDEEDARILDIMHATKRLSPERYEEVLAALSDWGEREKKVREAIRGNPDGGKD